MNIIIKKILKVISSVFLMIIFFVYSTHTIHAASLSLTWNANTEADLAGYRIYYGTSPGSYQASQDLMLAEINRLAALANVEPDPKFAKLVALYARLIQSRTCHRHSQSLKADVLFSVNAQNEYTERMANQEYTLTNTASVLAA